MSVANIGVLQEPFRKRKWCLRDFADTQEGLRNHFATTCYLRRAAKLASTLRFQASFSRHGSCIVRRRNTLLYKSAARFSQQKADSATLQSDLLAVAVTSSFQLRIVHRLKHWILDFLSFEMVYRMQKMDFWKCSKSAKEDCSWLSSVFFTLFFLSPCFSPCIPLNDFGKGL